MLHKRLIATVMVKNGWVVQSIGFEKFLPVGRPEVTVEFLNNWGIDEIILLDIHAGIEGRCPDIDLVRKVSKYCFVPLTVGGGVRTIEHIRAIIHSGADKVAINTEAFRNPDIIEEGANIFGSQCLIVSIDAAKMDGRKYRVATDSGKNVTDISPQDFAKIAQNKGAGEILVNSIERDGSKRGYDTKLLRSLSSAVNIPVIALGGVSTAKDFVSALELPNVSAVAAGNYFHFVEHSAALAKSFLISKGINIRLDSPATYKDFEFDDDSRILKRAEEYLGELIYEHIPKETI